MEYNADERRRIVPAGRRCYGTRFRPLGVVEDASSRKGMYSYSYRLACRARQHDSSCVISIPPYRGSSSSSSSSSDRGGGAERDVTCVRRAQQQ